MSGKKGPVCVRAKGSSLSEHKCSVCQGKRVQSVSGQRDPVCVHDITYMFPNQEEADSRIFLSAMFSSLNEVDRIVVYSPDNDVLFLLLHHHESIHAKELFRLTDHQGKYADLTRYAPTHSCNLPTVDKRPAKHPDGCVLHHRL